MATTFDSGARVPEKAPRAVTALPEAEVLAEPPVKGGRIWGVLRIAMGWIFLWSFLDKLLALGFSTGRDPETGIIDFFGPAAWINGGSPTDGFLQFGLHTKGALVDFYSTFVGMAWVEWIYMASMLLIGLALIVGIGTRLAAIGGIAWMVIFYTASAVWPEHNPFVDDHVIEAIVLAGIAYVGAGRYLGLGNWWRNTALVRRFPILE